MLVISGGKSLVPALFFGEPRLDAFLFVGLRRRHVLAVRYHPRGDGRAERLFDIGARTLRHLLGVQQAVIFFAPAA
jgi:hypothetical protein